MKNVRSASSLFTMAVCLFAAVTFIAWQPDTTRKASSKNNHSTNSDTTVPKSSYPDEINLQLNFDSVLQQLNVQLSKIDYAKINADIQKSMAQIDYNKLNNDINTAMKNVDWEKMKFDVAKSLDSAKLAINNIKWDEMKAEVAKAQIEAKKAMTMQINMDSLHIQVQKSLQDAQKSLQSAKADWQNYKALEGALKRDGLITAGKPYTIQLKNGILYLNGTKQTEATTDKYRKYYSGKKNFTLKNEDGGEDL